LFYSFAALEVKVGDLASRGVDDKAGGLPIGRLVTFAPVLVDLEELDQRGGTPLGLFWVAVGEVDQLFGVLLEVVELRVPRFTSRMILSRSRPIMACLPHSVSNAIGRVSGAASPRNTGRRL